MKKIFIALFSFLVFSVSFSQERPTTFFNVRCVNGSTTKGTVLANPESKIKIKLGSDKITSRKISLGDNLEDQYTLYFSDRRFDYKAVFYKNSIKIYKSINSEYKLIYDIETYEDNSYFIK
jgi:hypothetical protein